MEDINKFLGGMNQDSHPTNQPENTTTNLVNFVPVSKNGNMYSVTNESGTTLMNITFPGTMKVIGSTILNTDIIVLLVDSLGNCQVGIIKEDSAPHDTYGLYHPIGPVDSSGNPLFNNKELGWSLDYPISVKARKLINGHRIIYFVDNYNPIGTMDLDSPPVEGEVLTTSKLIFDQKIPIIKVKEIKENVSANQKAGIVQFISRYVTSSGGITTVGLASEPFPIVPSLKKEGVDNYKGGFYEYSNINKSLELEITNVDTNFKELELIVVYYKGSQSTFTASVLGQIPINSSKLKYSYTGPNTENEVALTKEELRQLPIAYDKAKCIEQKNNVLFLSNLSSSKDTFDSILQEVANKVRVGYRIEELKFSGRGGNSLSEEINLVPLTTKKNDSSLDLEITFNKTITTATNTNFILHKTGNPATASILINTSSTMITGDFFTIPSGPSQPAVIITLATSIGNLSNKFLIGSSPADTALNISKAINDSPDVSEYFAYTINESVFLAWKTNDLSVNNLALSFSGNPTCVTLTSFTGANSMISSHTCTLTEIQDKIINLTFSVFVSLSDTLQILSVSSEALTYTTGTTDFLTITEPSDEELNISSSTDFSDYTNELIASTKKGYRRGEVYSLAYSLLYSDGSYSSAYHIPAFDGYINEFDWQANTNKFPPLYDDAWPDFSQSKNSSGKLGTYTSTSVYPSLQNYPGNLPGDANYKKVIRHHLMPDLQNEPSFRVDSSGVTWLRILDLTFEFTENIPNHILKNVKEILFLREKRDTNINRSVLSQGLFNRQVITADSFNNYGRVEGTVINGGTSFPSIKNGYYSTEIPFFDNLTEINLTGKNESKSNGGHTRAGIVYPNILGKHYSGNYNDGLKQSSDFIHNAGVFHSPESELLSGLSLDPEFIGGAKLQKVMTLKGDYKKVGEGRAEWRSEGAKDFLSKEPYYDVVGEYNNYITSLFPESITIDKSRKIEPGVIRNGEINSNEPGINSGTRWTSGGLELLLANNVEPSIGSQFSLKIDINFYGASAAESAITSIRKTYKTGDLIDKTYNESVSTDWKKDRLIRNLYNIVLDNKNQYDQISNTSFILIARKPIKNESGFFYNYYDEIYGGDTFITKFSYTGGQLIHYTGYDRNKDSSINRPSKTNSSRLNGYDHVDGINKLGNTENLRAWGADFRWNTYYFVESNINTHYRHKNPNEKKQNYFPNTSDYSLLLNDYFPYLGNVSEYNTQYSYENNVKEFFTKGSTESLNASFENRTIYSQQATSDDTLDSFRVFLQNDYYDLPTNSGPIWNSFVAYDTLFLHTPKSLWKTFSEASATLEGGNISEVVLGTGSLFSRPSQQIAETKGGYAGTISQFGGVHTPIGYAFPDILQGKIFLLALSSSGIELNDISEKGMSTFFNNNLFKGIISISGNLDYSNISTENAHLIDNPFKQIGINSGYDYSLKRIFFVKHGQNPFTISFSILTNNWFSFHDYMPRMILTINNRVLFYNGISMWEMNTGEKGNFFGIPYYSVLEYICNGKNNLTKTFQNLVIYSDSYLNGVKIKNNNFSTISVVNDRCNSGELALVFPTIFGQTQDKNQVFIKQKNDEYRIAIPRDAVKNNENALDASNIYTPQGGNLSIDSDYAFRERIKGDYAKIILRLLNLNNTEFVLNYISTIFNNNLR